MKHYILYKDTDGRTHAMITPHQILELDIMTAIIIIKLSNGREITAQKDHCYVRVFHTKCFNVVKRSIL